MNMQLMIKVHCLEHEHSGWYLQASAGCRTAAFYLHTEQECGKADEKQFWGAEFCTLHFPFSVLGQAAESRLLCLKIQNLNYLPLLCRFHPWEQCPRKDTADHGLWWGRKKHCVRGSDFPCETFHLILRQTSLCRPLPKRSFCTYNRSHIPRFSCMYEVPCRINISYIANCIYYTVQNFFF